MSDKITSLLDTGFARILRQLRETQTQDIFRAGLVSEIEDMAYDCVRALLEQSEQMELGLGEFRNALRFVLSSLYTGLPDSWSLLDAGFDRASLSMSGNPGTTIYALAIEHERSKVKTQLRKTKRDEPRSSMAS